MLLLHLCERWLARVAVSEWRDSLILKGGLNLYSRYRETARPTRDIDLAAVRIQATPEDVQRVLTAVLTLDLSDGVTFLPETLTTHSILEDARYSGLRALFVGTLSDSASKATLQIDLSFGNAITPAPAVIAFPNALGLPDTTLLGYPLESIIAEKLAALIELGAATTRLKDVYDLHQITTRDPPSADLLARALRATFERRGTSLDDIASAILALSRDPRLQREWQRFLQDSGLRAPAVLEDALTQVVGAVEAALLETTF